MVWPGRTARFLWSILALISAVVSFVALHFPTACLLSPGHDAIQIYAPFSLDRCYAPSSPSGHGECYLGWCKCHTGYFGHDCAYREPSVPWTSGLLSERPWLADHVSTLSSQDPPPSATRKRPLIYIYELPTKYNQLMLQYRTQAAACFHRNFGEGNETDTIDGWMYSVETGLHEMIAQSPHRTLDPEVRLTKVTWHINTAVIGVFPQLKQLT